MNPIEWLAWIHGKLFVNYPILGYAVACSFGALVMFVLWTRAVDKYNEQHSTVPDLTRSAAAAENSEGQQQPAKQEPTKKIAPKSPPVIQSVPPGTHIEQRSTGPNSPNIVGDRNQVIINPKPEPRRLSEDQKMQLVKALSSFPKPNISVLRWPGGPEAMRFGDDFIDLFKKLGWVVIGDSQSLTQANGSGMAIVVKSLEDRHPAADTLLNMIHQMGFKVEGSALPTLKSDEIRIVIAPAE